MIRYWKIITLCTFTVVIIGSFYIQTGLAEKTDIKIIFETIRGAEVELEDLSISAEYEKSNIYQSLRFTTKETLNVNKLSLLESLNGAYTIPIYKKLVEEYKRFMRGKVVSPENYYEDENVVAYAAIETESTRKFAFEIDVLNKASGKNTAFKVDFPEKEKYNWLNVAKVQVIEGKLKVFVRGSAENSEMILATFDILEQKLEKSKLLLSSSDNWLNIRLLHDYQSIGYERYVLFYKENQGGTSEEARSTMDADSERTNTELMVYDLVSDELKSVKSPEDVQSMLYSASIQDATLLIPSKSKEGIEIHPYDIEKEQWGDTIKFDMTSQKVEGPYESYMKLTDGKFYVVSAEENGHALLIGDITTGKVLYEGVLKVEKDGKLQSDYRLYINGLKVDR